MADQRTMAELLRAPTKGYAEAIVVPPILAEQFELKHSLINMTTSDHDANSSSFEIAKLTHAVNQQTSVVTTAMTAILKQFQSTPPPASVKAVEEICVTCGGAHPYYQCLAADGNIFLELRDNIQGYVAASVVNYNQGHLPSNTIASPNGALKAITTRSGFVLDGPSIPIPPPFINPKEDERVEETLTDQDLVEYTIKVPPPLVQKPKHALILIPKCQKMLKALLSNKEKLLGLTNTPLNENCSAVILKKLPEKLKDPGKFLIPTTSSSLNQLLEEFADELALITFPPGNDDLPFDIEPDLKEIEYLLNHDPIKEMDYILNDSIDQSNLADLNDNLIDTMPEMFTDEHALDYSSPPLYDEYDDDLFEVESDTEYVYDDPFNSKGAKIKESKHWIDELDLPSDFLPSSEYDSFLFEDFFEVDALPSTNKEDKVFNLGILIRENLFKVITHVAPDKNVKKLAISHASLILEDFDAPLYELPFFKEVPSAKTLLSFSFKNEKKKIQTRDSNF
nr:hypothetical protein [Tanacetum cinerariifolium]